MTVAENIERQDSLLKVLQSRSLRFYGGITSNSNNQFQDEPSILILGLSLAAAKVLAEKYQLNAFVWSGVDAMPQLVLLR